MDLDEQGKPGRGRDPLQMSAKKTAPAQNSALGKCNHQINFPIPQQSEVWMLLGPKI